MNKLIIIGAGGHGKVIADNALKNGYTDIGFLDDCTAGECMGFPVIGVTADAEKFNDGNTDFIIGIGNNAVRKTIAEKLNLNWATLIHPSAQIAVNVSVGAGTVIMANAVVNVCSSVGEHCIINTGSVIEHDNIIKNYVHISPKACLCGTVTVGECSWIGAGTSVINNVDICDNVTVGAGSVVIKDIKTKGTYYGLVR